LPVKTEVIYRIKQDNPFYRVINGFFKSFLVDVTRDFKVSLVIYLDWTSLNGHIL